MKYLFIVSLFMVLLCWEILPQVFEVPSYLFPQLSEVIVSISPGNNSASVSHFLSTSGISFVGLFVGCFVGFGIGIVMHQVPILEKLLFPYVIASNAIPVVAIAPVILLWFGYGLTATAAVSAFLCFFPLCINTYKGLGSYSYQYRSLFEVYNATAFQFFVRYKLPHALPYITAGLKLNAVFAVVGAIVAEFIGSDKGLGYAIIQASHSMNTSLLWGYVLLSCILGLSFYILTYGIERVLLKKFHHPLSSF